MLITMLLLVSCSKEQLVTREPTEPAETPQQTNNSINAMFVQVCEEGKDVKGPWKGDLMLSRMDDSTMRTGEEQLFAESGGVPTVVEDANGRLISAFQWFSCDNEEAFDKVAVKISEDEGVTWSDPETVKFEELPEEYQRPFDPTLVLTEDGKIRMYFTSNNSGTMMLDKTNKIYSAISEDGVNYTFEPGVRFEVENAPAYDSAVGYFKGLWYLLTPQNDEQPKGAHFATSEDGLTFTTQEDIIPSIEVNWTGNFLAKENALYFYGTPNGKDGNWYTKTEDGKTWSEPIYLKSNYGGDPSVFCPDNGDCLVIGTMMAKKKDSI